MRFTILTLCLLLAGITHAQTDPELAFVLSADGFSQPVDVTGSGEGSNRLFVVEKRGRVKVMDHSTGDVQADLYLDLSEQVLSNSERGLLGIAFHPDFATNGYFYVNYISDGTGTPSSGQTVISRFQAVPANATTVDIATETVLLTISQPASNHNAGDLAFGPDGYLYIPTGDGGFGGDPDENSLDPQSLLGKMLRIDVDNTDPGLEYAIPANNPFVGDPSTRDEIWALGLRNPWRISFDRETGDLWIGDVGQGQREEIDFQPAISAGGQNYGWDCREGTLAYTGSTGDNDNHCDPNTTYTEPLADYDRGNMGGRSITGGFVYRGTDASDLVGYYVLADYADDRFFLITPEEVDVNNRSSARTLVPQPPIAGAPGSVSSFGEDDDGNLYVLSLFDGELSKVTTQLALPVTLTTWTAEALDKTVALKWTTTAEENTANFVLERSADGTEFSTLATVPAIGNSTEEEQYEFTDEQPLNGYSYYRLLQRDLDGQEEVFRVRTVFFQDGPTVEPTLSPNPTNGEFIVELPGTERQQIVNISVYDATGRQVYERLRIVNGDRRRLVQQLPEVAAGLYRVLIEVDGTSFTKSLIVK